VDDDKPFYGIDLPFFKLGFSDYSFKAGVNLGVVKADTSLGKSTGVAAEAGLPGVAIVGGNVGMDIDDQGLHGNAGGKADFLKEHEYGIGGAAVGGFDLGPKTGGYVGQDARALGFQESLGVGANVSDKGLRTGYKANAGFDEMAGVKSEFGLGLGPDSLVKKELGFYAGDANLKLGAGIDSGGNNYVRPDVYAEGGIGNDHTRADLGAQVGPSLDLSVGAGYDHVDTEERSEKGGDVVASIGTSGVGVKFHDYVDGEKINDGKHGFGTEYSEPEDMKETLNVPQIWKPQEQLSPTRNRVGDDRLVNPPDQNHIPDSGPTCDLINDARQRVGEGPYQVASRLLPGASHREIMELTRAMKNDYQDRTGDLSDRMKQMKVGEQFITEQNLEKILRQSPALQNRLRRH
ncbi:MAG: hypothetical protein K8F91_10705, partial [Candidatus Obscuribacterales bacterium]|nr:hypothetical protein [Candidatus Obscuribacterales bacterium]